VIKTPFILIGLLQGPIAHNDHCTMNDLTQF